MMTKVLAVPCLLALIPSSGAAQVARVSAPVSPLTVVSGAFASAPGLQTTPSAAGASFADAPILPLSVPTLLNASPAPAPVAVAKPALPGLESGAARFAQAARANTSAEAGQALSKAMFDAAADKNGSSETPAVDALAAELTNEAISSLRAVLSNGYWGAAIPGVKPSKDVYGRPSEDRAEVSVESYSHAEPSFGEREDISLNLRYESDSRYTYVDFRLSDAPERYDVTRFERTADRIVIETRVRERGWNSNGDRSRVTIALNPEGKAVGMTIENWNSWMPFVKRRRSAVFSPEIRPAPFVYLPKA